ncbi:DUF7144 family membrane protein [Jatrophihabitans sp. DSM 45814]
MDVRTEQSAPVMSAWVGWIVFGGAMLILSGLFTAIWGLVALVRDEFFVVAPSGNIFDVDYPVWGWITIVLGVVSLAVGVALLAGSRPAQLSAIVLSLLSVVVHLLLLFAYPVWSLVVIAMDVTVIYAIAVHGRELQPARGSTHFSR